MELIKRNRGTQESRDFWISYPFDNIDFETFRLVKQRAINDLTDKKPNCWNGGVNVRKFRVRVELVHEHIEVVRERIIELWEKCNNHNHMGPLMQEAARYEVDLSKYQCGGKK